MKRRTFLSRVRAWAGSRANLQPPRGFRLAFEPLDDRRLLSLTTWAIDPAQSYLSLAIADQVVNYDGTDITLRVRNQTGDSGPWNEGNSAAIAGTIRTNYLDGHSIEFLAGQVDIVGVESGAYRPNPSDFDPDATDAENPLGRFLGTSAAPAVFGGRVRASLVVLWEVTVDAGFVSLGNITYEVASGLLPITGNRFDSNLLTVGIRSSDLGVDGASMVVIGQPVPDALTTITDVTTYNGAPTGTITDLGGQNRRLTIPCALELSFPIDDDPAHDLRATATGQLVATAVVDRPPANFWHNYANPCDVDGLTGVAPLDALIAIGYINNHPGDASLPASPAVGPPYYDVDLDNQITALDVLAVVNYLNRPASGEGEASSIAWGAVVGAGAELHGAPRPATSAAANRSITDLSRWPQLHSRGVIRGQDGAVGQGAAPGDGGIVGADLTGGARQAADPRFSPRPHRERSTAPRRTPDEECLPVAIPSELGTILTEIADAVATAGS